jgi:hypothetical protein
MLGHKKVLGTYQKELSLKDLKDIPIFSGSSP